MALINSIPRDTRVLIDGLDCTTAVTQISGGYAHRDQSGLCKMTGELTLQRPIAWTEDLDDRTNPRWARGKTVTVSILNFSTGTFEPAPIIGSARILRSEYDGFRTLQIEFGGLLSLFDGWTPPGKGFCFPLRDDDAWTADDDPKTVQNIAKKILATYGVTELVGTLSGRLEAPLSKLAEGSLIAVFGQLCYADRKIAFQNRLGQIELKAIAPQPTPHTTLVAQDAAQAWTRLTGVETPCEKIRVTGTKLKATPTGDLEPSISIQRGPASVISSRSIGRAVLEWRSESQTIETNDEGLRTTVDKVDVRKPVKLIFPDSRYVGGLTWFEQVKQTKTYEARTDGGCSEPDEGRILKTTETIRRPVGVALAQWIANKQAQEPDWSINRTTLITAEENITTYTYSDGDIPTYIESVQSVPIGAILTDDISLRDPKSRKKTQRTVQYWKKTRPGEWVEYRKEWQAYVVAFPEAIAALEADGSEVTTATKLALVQTKNERYPSNTGQSQPPNPERYPPDATVAEIPLVAEVSLRSPLSQYEVDREREFNLETGYAQSVEQLEAIAEQEGLFLWGRWKGTAFGFALTDQFFDLKPLDCLDWVETSGKTRSYLLDSLSIAIAARECVLAADGVWVGVRSEGLGSPPSSGEGQAGGDIQATPKVLIPAYRKVLPWRIEQGWEFSVQVEPRGSYIPPVLRLLPPEPTIRLAFNIPFIPTRSLSTNSHRPPRLSLNVPDTEVIDVDIVQGQPPRLSLEAPISEASAVDPSASDTPKLILNVVGAESVAITPSESRGIRLTLGAWGSEAIALPVSEVQPARLTVNAPTSEVFKPDFSEVTPAILQLNAPLSEVLNPAPSAVEPARLQFGVPTSPVLNPEPSAVSPALLQLNAPLSEVLNPTPSAIAPARLQFSIPTSPVLNPEPSAVSPALLQLNAPLSEVLNPTPSAIAPARLQFSIPTSPVLDPTPSLGTPAELRLQAPLSESETVTPSPISPIHLNLQVP